MGEEEQEGPRFISLDTPTVQKHAWMHAWSIGGSKLPLDVSERMNSVCVKDFFKTGTLEFLRLEMCVSDW